MTANHRALRVLLMAALLPSCAPKPKGPPDPLTLTPCRTWEVTVDNELAFPVSVFVYSATKRTSLGAVFPGISSLRSADSGQITFTPPLGQSLMQRGKQVRATLACVERAPA